MRAVFPSRAKLPDRSRQWLANRMMHEFMAQDDIAPLAMEGVLLEMLAESARSSDETHGSSAPSWLRRVRETLEDSYLEGPGSGCAGGHRGCASGASFARVPPALSNDHRRIHSQAAHRACYEASVEFRSVAGGDRERLRFSRSEPFLRLVPEALRNDTGQVSQHLGAGPRGPAQEAPPRAV